MNPVKLLDNVGLFRLTRGVLKQRRSIAILLHGTYAKTYRRLPAALHFGMHVEEFEKVLQWLERERIPRLHLLDFLEGRPGLLVTFDDAYANKFEYALPLLEKHACPATFFVATKHVNDASGCRWLDNFAQIIAEHGLDIDADTGYELFYGMTPDQIRALASHPLVSIGAHSHRHTSLPRCGEAAIRADIAECNDILAELTKTHPATFCYPFGDYDERCLRIVRESGYRAAFAVKPRLRHDRSFEIPRIGIYRGDSSYLSAKLAFLFRHL